MNAQVKSKPTSRRYSDEEKARARKIALLASRTNFVLSVPMLMCMGASNHPLPF